MPKRRFSHRDLARIGPSNSDLARIGPSNRFYDERYERCFDVQIVEMRGTVSGVVSNNIPSLNQVYDYGYDAK